MLIPEDKHDRPIEARQKGSGESGAQMSSSPLSMVNVIPAQVAAIHRGLVRVGIRLRVGDRTDLAVRLPLGHRLTSDLWAGQRVRALIPSEGVQLEVGYFRQGKRRWNRWIGQIVLVESLQDRRVVTVKLHNEQITLRSCGSMTGTNWVPQVWDTVNIVVDPTTVSLDADGRNAGTQAVSQEEETLDPFRDARVWLRAQVMELGDASEGKLLSLLIGTARVSVFVGREEDSFGRWTRGMTLEIHVGRYEAWLKPCGSHGPPVSCGLLYLDYQSLAGAR